jgi:uncharacterized membrane protein YphA (DoxX/SURF4 family)
MSMADPGTTTHRESLLSKAAAIAFIRIFLGVMWLFEVTVGHNWKIGGFGSDVHPGWLGANRGDVVREDVAQAIADGTWSWFASLYESVVVPNAVLFSWLTIIFQVALGIAFIVGFAVRPLALMALVLDFSIFMLGNSRIPPFFTAMHLFVLGTGAGRFYGLDGYLLGRLADARRGLRRVFVWVLRLPLFGARFRGIGFAATALLSMYFFLAIPLRETVRFQMVSLELAALFGLVALALYASTLIPDRLGVIAATMRIFVGFKLLHEIWVRVTPGVNGLPGWAGSDQLRPLFETISENHWGLFSWIVDTAFLPALGFWAIVFGVVQFAVGVALVLGFKTRPAALLGALYVGGLIILGMTRYAPFLLGVLVPVIALDGGRYLSVDRVLEGNAYRERFGLPVPRRFVLPLIGLAAVNAAAAVITAFVSGIEPGSYVGSMAAMTTAMVAVFSGLFAFVGWLQLRPTMAVIPPGASDLIGGSP